MESQNAAAQSCRVLDGGLYGDLGIHLHLDVEGYFKVRLTFRNEKPLGMKRAQSSMFTYALVISGQGNLCGSFYGQIIYHCPEKYIFRKNRRVWQDVTSYALYFDLDGYFAVNLMFPNGKSSWYEQDVNGESAKSYVQTCPHDRGSR